MKAILFFLIIPAFSFSQTQIITAFPSLRIPASSRGLAMGDCGIASANENQQLWYNPAKSAFMQNYHQVSVSYTPWMAAVSNDTRFMNVNYLANISSSSAFGLSLSYLSMGAVQTRDNNGAILSQNNAYEYNLLSNLALQLNERNSLGVGLRFLVSQPDAGFDPVTGSAIARHVFSASADISYYHKFEMGEGRLLETGLSVTNLGPKINVGSGSEKVFLPTNVGIGVSYSFPAGAETNSFVIAADANKLLVPSPPLRDANGNILAGKDPNRSVLNALFSSFGDAPGGFIEELREIRINAGAEFGFDRSFFLRGGISLENAQKGNRKFVGLGVGYKGVISDQSWGIDFHYLVPIQSTAIVSTFQNAFGFTVKFNIGSFD